MTRDSRPEGAASLSPGPVDNDILAQAFYARTDRDHVDPGEKVRAHLDRILGDTGGYLHCASKIHTRPESFVERAFVWPEQRDVAVAWLLGQDDAGRESYYCPYVLSGLHRAQRTAIRRTFVHADVDNGHFDATRVEHLGALAVASGSVGNAHVYVKLDRSVGPEEHRALSSALIRYLRADPGKKSDNDLLRPAGTHNHKRPAAPQLVHQLQHGVITEHNPAALASLLEELNGSFPQPEQALTHLPVNLCSFQPRGSSLPTHTLTGKGGDDDVENKCGQGRPGKTHDHWIEALPFRIQRMIIRGRSDDYQSRSEARLAVAMSAQQHGVSLSCFSRGVLDPSLPVSQWYRHKSYTSWQLVQQDWVAARRFVDGRPPVQTKEDALLHVKRLREATLRLWRGRGGSIDREVMRALLDLGESLGSILFSVSVRELAELIGRESGTVRSSLVRLQREGWILRTDPGHAALRVAATYSLQIPRHLSSAEHNPEEWTAPHDWWSHLPPSARHIYETLLGCPGSVPEIAARTGIGVKAVRRQLKDLREDRLASEGPAGWSALVSDPDELSGHLDALAVAVGVQGKLQARAQRFERERMAPLRP